MNNIINQFNDSIEQLLPTIKNYKINPKYIVLLSFILVLKSYYDLSINNYLSFSIMFILSQYFNQLYSKYINDINDINDINNSSYKLLQKKLNYLKFMLYLSVLFVKYSHKITFTNIIVILVIFLIHLNYSPCYYDIYNEDHEIKFENLTSQQKLLRILKNKNKLKYNFLFGDICSVLFLIIFVFYLNAC
jgi:hypothetical protein